MTSAQKHCRYYIASTLSECGAKVAHGGSYCAHHLSITAPPSLRGLDLQEINLTQGRSAREALRTYEPRPRTSRKPTEFTHQLNALSFKRSTSWNWKQREDDIIVKFYLKPGISAAMIAKKLGKTKNAVIGRANRLRAAGVIK